MPTQNQPPRSQVTHPITANLGAFLAAAGLILLLIPVLVSVLAIAFALSTGNGHALGAFVAIFLGSLLVCVGLYALTFRRWRRRTSGRSPAAD